MKKIIYFFEVNCKSTDHNAFINRHLSYWDELNLPNYSINSFANGAGGIISFSTENIKKAFDYVTRDPLARHDMIEYSCVKELAEEKKRIPSVKKIMAGILYTS